MKRLFYAYFLVYAGVCLYTLTTRSILSSVLGRMSICWLSSLVVMIATFIYASRHKRYDYVDLAWGLSITAISVTGFFLQHGKKVKWDPQSLATMLVLAWGVRLALRMYRRLKARKVQDKRYDEIINKWKTGSKTAIFLRIFVAQSVLAIIVSIPIIHINLSGDTGWSWLTFAGLAMFTIGLTLETVADRQLDQFRAANKQPGQLFRGGLRNIVRYPNYLGEMLVWWGLAVISLGTSYGWVGTGGAMFISFLLIYVSGLPPQEKASTSKPGWAEYKAKTPALLPFTKW